MPSGYAFPNKKENQTTFTIGTMRFYLVIGTKAAGKRHLESGGKEATSQGTNHGFFLGFLGFDATAVIMA